MIIESKTKGHDPILLESDSVGYLVGNVSYDIPKIYRFMKKEKQASEPDKAFKSGICCAIAILQGAMHEKAVREKISEYDISIRYSDLENLLNRLDFYEEGLDPNERY
jgi:hypothetical protein